MLKICILSASLLTSAFSQEAFDWSKVLNIPSPISQEAGNQILHFNSKNKPYTHDKKAVEFVKGFLQGATPLQSDAEVLRFASDAVTLKEGFFLEMGVCTGKTTNFIAALNPTRKIYGFDSFEGLPEDWQHSNERMIPKGTFAFHNPHALPPVLPNVILYKGWFKDTLPLFQKQSLKKQPIAFLHIDSDIYLSAKEVFTLIGDNIVPGTIIVFDEFYNYPNFEQHEFKAFKEFLQKRQLKARFLAFNVNHEQVAVQIVN